MLHLIVLLILLLGCGAQSEETGPMTFEEKMKKGAGIYSRQCMACHMVDGKGLFPAFPPVAESDYLMADLDRSIRILIEGQQGPLTVNGKEYNGVMAPQFLDDRSIAAVLTFVRNSMGNKGDEVMVERVEKVRESLGK